MFSHIKLVVLILLNAGLLIAASREFIVGGIERKSRVEREEYAAMIEQVQKTMKAEKESKD